MSDYTPVACHFHDKLEAAATLKRTASITYQNESGEVSTAEGKIIDIYAKEGADYCKVEDGTIIRLDKLKTVEAGGEKLL
ncbi:MAG: hypothetical protein AB8B99_00885 [Phormidesmis sp.]